LLRCCLPIFAGIPSGVAASEPAPASIADNPATGPLVIEQQIVGPIVSTVHDLCSYRRRVGRWPAPGDFPGADSSRYESYQVRFEADASYDAVFRLPSSHFEWQLLLETDHPSDQCDTATLFLRGKPRKYEKNFRYAVRRIDDASWSAERRRELSVGIIEWTAVNIVADEPGFNDVNPAAQEFAGALARGLVEGIVKGALCVLLKASNCI